MDEAEKLALLKTMNSEEEESELKHYLLLAAFEIINRAFPFGTGAESVPDKYAVLQVEIANFLLAKRGAEGQTSHTENGVTRAYGSSNVPESFLAQIVPECGVPS